jgi:hypothetical protein
MPSGSLPGERRGGRAKGALNKKTVEQIKAIEAGGLMPLDFMLQVLRDTSLEYDVRLDAAGRAAPYCHARVQAREDISRVNNHFTIVLAWNPQSESTSANSTNLEISSSNITNGSKDGRAS